MWIIRVIQSGVVNTDDKIKCIQPRCHKVEIINLDEFGQAVENLNIDQRCISLIELEHV